MLIYLSLLVAVIGLLIYVLSAGKLAEIGKLMFACGLLAFLFGAASGRLIGIVPR